MEARIYTPRWDFWTQNHFALLVERATDIIHPYLGADIQSLGMLLSFTYLKHSL
jgi:hypothetical protein